MTKRDKIGPIIQAQIKNKNLFRHMLAAEACMIAIGRELGANKLEDWAIAGLIHDLDYQEGISDEEHGTRTGQILEQEGIKVSDEILHAVAAHNWGHNNIKPKTDMAWALFCCDSLTGLIVACALVRPDKKLASLTVDSVLKKFPNKKFAAGTRREDIKMCKKQLGIKLERFVEICLTAMQRIHRELGL